LKLNRTWTRVAIVLILSIYSADLGRSQPPISDVVIEHVTVLPMTPLAGVIRDATVVIHAGKIAQIARHAVDHIDRGAQRIDGRGKWLMPALTDAHVHLENDRLLRLFLNQPNLPDGLVRTDDALLPYVANGILQIFDLSAMSETLAQRAEVESGRVLGPNIIAAAMIDGVPPVWPIGLTRVAGNPEEGRNAVRGAAAEGYDLIKVYSKLDLATFTAILDEARKVRLRVVGHVPARGQGITEKFFQPGFDLVAHAEEFAQQTPVPDESAIPRYVEMAKRNGTGLIATLSLDDRLVEETRDASTLRSRPEMAYLQPVLRTYVIEHNPYVAVATPDRVARLKRIVAFNRKLTAASSAAGVVVLAGTDALVPGVVPGFSLHDELRALVIAGLTPRQALESATSAPCAWLGQLQDCGIVAPGARADLLLLDADPLANISNTRQIYAVIVRGRYVARAELDRRLRELKIRNEQAR
jgi:imidazolonepropionase-like amidohydrolase